MSKSTSSVGYSGGVFYFQDKPKVSFLISSSIYHIGLRFQLNLPIYTNRRNDMLVHVILGIALVHIAVVIYHINAKNKP